MVDVILKIKTSLPETAAECLAIFGEGGYQLGEGETIEDVQVENWIGHVNTPLLQGYTRVRIGEYFGQALEFIDANGGSVNADLVRVEWPLGEDDEPYPPFEVEVDAYDIDGKVIGTRMQEIGSF